MSSEEYKLLDTISSPRELKKLPPEELSAYCDELRRYIIDECAVNPGHLASSLGAVELAAALHYVFDTPEDRIVWDVGHQTYAHKIITGRREAFKTKRQLNGISGFPRMSESEYDSFGGGHASVSISAAFGMAKAAELRGEKRQVVAVIGDGSMTGGLAFEGLNNAGASKRTNLLVILNDNNMAIDQATGALKNYLLKISTSVHYNRFKQRLWGLMSHTPRLLRLCQKAGNAVKQGLLNKSNFFESLNFRYFGPVDGHNLKELVRTLRALRDIEGPKLLHVMTVKGKGYLPAEHDQPAWHAPGRFNPDTGERISAPGGAARYQDVFGETLLELARRDGRVVGVTPAMPSGCSMNILLREMPGRLEEMPGEEGYPAYLGSRLAQFYERAGRVVSLGSDGREGALSVIGAVSPPGGDISEPVSQATLRIVKVFWGLDSALAYKRHFPAINWLTSYSLYADSLGSWFNDNVSEEWTSLRARLMALLSDEASLDEIVKLVGMDALSPTDRLKMETARSIREDFLHQLAFHEVDTYSSLRKQYLMMKLVLRFYDGSLDALKKGANIEKLVSIPSRESIGRFKYVHENDIEDTYKTVCAAIDSEIKAAVDAREDY